MNVKGVLKTLFTGFCTVAVLVVAYMSCLFKAGTAAHLVYIVATVCTLLAISTIICVVADYLACKARHRTSFVVADTGCNLFYIPMVLGFVLRLPEPVRFITIPAIAFSLVLNGHNWLVDLYIVSLFAEMPFMARGSRMLCE